MIDYEDVVKERYDRETYDTAGIYWPINPIGYYGQYKVIEVIRNFILHLQKTTKKSISELSLLDCGCGTGQWTRLAAEFTSNPQNIYGFEYSETRLQRCKELNPAIHYEKGDLARGGAAAFQNLTFDGVIASVVFMHLRKKEDIESALRYINSKMQETSLFLWYEACAQTHDMNYEADHQGYSPKEMDLYAKQAGFSLVEASYQDKTIKLPPVGSFSTYYNRLDGTSGLFLRRALSKLCFWGKPINTARIYRKVRQL